MRPVRCLMIALLLLASQRDVAEADPETEELLAGADSAIQARISALFHARDETEAFRRLQSLKEAAEDADDKEELTKQVAIFAVTGPEQKEFPILSTAAILHRLELPRSVPIRVLALYLDSENPQLREFAREWFDGFEASDKDAWDAYTSYASGKIARNDEVPQEFVEFIYQRSPQRALLVFYRASRAPEVVARLKAISRSMKARRRGEPVAADAAEPPAKGLPKEVLLASHLVDDALWYKQNGFDEQFQKALPVAKEQLAKLADHDQWWVRLYVAAMMRPYRELQQAEVLERLSADENAMVSKAAQAIKR